MPTRTVWIREDDLEAFEAIPDRPEWLHRAILRESELMAAPAGVAEAQVEKITPLQVNPKSHNVAPDTTYVPDSDLTWVDESDMM